MARTRRTYDHRLRELVRQTGDLTTATGLGVPRSTAVGWLGRGDPSVVTAEPLSAGGVSYVWRLEEDDVLAERAVPPA